MTCLAMAIESYLKENVDDHIKINPWLKKNDFPLFLRNGYNFYEMTILETPCILVEVINESPGIDKLQKQIKQIENLADRQIVLFYKIITRYRRKSLIKNRIAFVIESGQMYLPFLGLDLKIAQEHIEKKVNGFTTSAQIAYLYFLYHKDEIVNMTEFSKKMGFTKMTASRALNDLYHANLITYEISGMTSRSKEYKRIPDPEYFLKGRAYLKSPAKKIIYVKTAPLDALIAGFDALANLSMINPPGHPVMAIDRQQVDTQEIEIVKNIDLIKDTNLVELQLWDYNPKLFSQEHHVDLMSLYASLKDETDERIEQALEEALRGESWYMD